MAQTAKIKKELEIARFHLDEWLEAELELTTHQSYKIGSRSLTRADLAQIRKEIEFWQNRVAELENLERRGGRNRMIRAVPRDL